MLKPTSWSLEPLCGWKYCLQEYNLSRSIVQEPHCLWSHDAAEQTGAQFHNGLLTTSDGRMLVACGVDKLVWICKDALLVTCFQHFICGVHVQIMCRIMQMHEFDFQCCLGMLVFIYNYIHIVHIYIYLCVCVIFVCPPHFFDHHVGHTCISANHTQKSAEHQNNLPSKQSSESLNYI